jgi:type II secretion system protein H
MSRRAFTLVEVVLVLAITAILAALAVPRFAEANTRYRVRLAAERVARELEHARERAAARATAQTLSFNTSARSFSIVAMPDPDRPASTYTITLADPPWRIERLATSFSGAAATYNGYGVPGAAGTVTVAAGGYVCTVRVEALTGVVSVDPLAKE